MFMEKFVMTTLTNEELDVPVTASAVACCKYCSDGSGPEELDATAEATAACTGCYLCYGD
jgi:hypothetical protein